jgi:hypothetical protein
MAVVCPDRRSDRNGKSLKKKKGKKKKKFWSTANRGGPRVLFQNFEVRLVMSAVLSNTQFLRKHAPGTKNCTYIEALVLSGSLNLVRASESRYKASQNQERETRADQRELPHELKKRERIKEGGLRPRRRCGHFRPDTTAHPCLAGIRPR